MTSRDAYEATRRRCCGRELPDGAFFWRLRLPLGHCGHLLVFVGQILFALAYSFGLTARHRPGAGKEYGTRPMPPVALAGCWLLALLYRRIANDFEHFCGENALSQEIKG